MDSYSFHLEKAKNSISELYVILNEAYKLDENQIYQFFSNIKESLSSLECSKGREDNNKFLLEAFSSPIKIEELKTNGIDCLMLAKEKISSIADAFFAIEPRIGEWQCNDGLKIYIKSLNIEDILMK